MDIPDLDGVTALSEASRNGHEDVCDILCKAGANTNIKDLDGVTALGKAVARKHFDICKILLEHGAEGEQAGDHLDDLLSWAAEHGLASVCQSLLKAGADIHLYQNNILQKYCYKQQENCVNI